MSTQLQSITSGATARRQPSRAGLAAMISCTLGLVVAPELASAQSMNDGVGVVQPTATPAAERHRARVTGNALGDAPLVQTPAPTKARHDTSVRGAAKVQHSRPMNRTAQAHLETSRAAAGLPSLAMVCQDCEPEPPCAIYPYCGSRNSSIIDGATIVVER